MLTQAGRRRRRRGRPHRPAGVYAGAWQAYLGDRVPQVYINSLRATVPSRFFVLARRQVQRADAGAGSPWPVHLLEGLFFGMQNTQQAVGQRERLLALGRAVGRADPRAQQPGVGGGPGHLGAAGSGGRNAPQAGADRGRLAGSGRLEIAGPAPGGSRRARGQGADLVALWRTSDREERLGEWLEEHGIDGGWDLAPTFVQGGMDEAFLDRVVAAVETQRRPTEPPWRAPSAGSTTPSRPSC